MQPSIATLLETIRSSAAALGALSDRPEWTNLVNVIDVCASDILMRGDRDFYVDRYRGAVELIARGNALLEKAGSPAAGEGVGPLPHDAPADELENALTAAGRALEQIILALQPTDAPDRKAYVADVATWERALYLKQAAGLPPAGGWHIDNAPFNPDALQAYMRERFPDRADLRITDFRNIPGGFSKLTIMFDVEDSKYGRESMVARVEPSIKFMDLDGMDITNEYPIVRFAYEAGIPVAEPLWLEADETKLGSRFFVSRKVSGAVFGTIKEIERTISDDVVETLAKSMAAVHTTPFRTDDPLLRASHFGRWLDRPRARENTLEVVHYWHDQFRDNATDPSPLLQHAFAWLEANPPEEDFPVRFLHGDVGLHNIMIEDGEVRALLDWENSRIGDPAEDFAKLQSGVEGRIDQQHLLDLYYKAGGYPVSEYRLRYFDVFTSVSVFSAALCPLARLDRFDNGNPNWAVFGLKFADHYAASILGGIERAERARGR